MNPKLSIVVNALANIGTHTKNGFTDGAFEHAVMAQFDRAGISYEYQPNGSHNAPDFNVMIDGTTFGVECKASNSGGIMWNCNYAHPEYLYLYHNSKLGETTYFMGDQMITKAEIDLLNEYADAAKKLADDYNRKLKAINSGWSVYPRKMFVNGMNIIRKFANK